MAKSTRRTAKTAVKKAKQTKKTAKRQTRVSESLDCLVELHKLQGVMLAQLRKDIS